MFICLFIILDFPSSDFARTWRWSFMARDVCIKLDIYVLITHVCIYVLLNSQSKAASLKVNVLPIFRFWVYMMKVIHSRHAMYALKYHIYHFNYMYANNYMYY